MNLTLTKMRLRVHHGLAALVLLAAAAGGSAHAGDVGISVGIHVPGVPVYVPPPPPPPEEAISTRTSSEDGCVVVSVTFDPWTKVSVPKPATW